jgi:hypothetical protein
MPGPGIPGEALVAAAQRFGTPVHVTSVATLAEAAGCNGRPAATQVLLEADGTLALARRRGRAPG